MLIESEHIIILHNGYGMSDYYTDTVSLRHDLITYMRYIYLLLNYLNVNYNIFLDMYRWVNRHNLVLGHSFLH